MMNVKMFLILFLVLVTAPAVHGQSHWQQIARPTTYNLNKMSFLDSLRGWACGEHGTILRTTDGGKSWLAQNSGGTDDIITIFMLNDRLGWASAWVEFTDTSTYYGTRILKTTNGGLSWLSTQFSETGKYTFCVTFFDSLNGWIGGDRGNIERTTDGGTTWTPAPVDSSVVAGFAVRNIAFYSRTYGYAMGGAFDILGAIWRTTNAGERWTVENVSPEPVFEMHFIDSLRVVALTGDYEFGPSIVKTKNGGEQWIWTYLEFGIGAPRGMSFRTPGEAWVPYSNQILVTHDTANTWKIADSLGNRQILHLVFTDSLTGYAVGDSGIIWKYQNRPVAVAEQNPVLPTSSRLMQNYPNPFNPATTIRFRVAAVDENNKVRLTVNDLLGREVAVLVNDDKPAGEYSVVWDARDCASGIYFYKLRSGSFVDVKKMLLVR